jgi:ABC-type methionine transport system ATPase subunit
MFIANMRLTSMSRAEKKAKVNEMIEILGLKKCADTYIGN